MLDTRSTLDITVSFYWFSGHLINRSIIWPRVIFMSCFQKVGILFTQPPSPCYKSPKCDTIYLSGQQYLLYKSQWNAVGTNFTWTRRGWLKSLSDSRLKSSSDSSYHSHVSNIQNRLEKVTSLWSRNRTKVCVGIPEWTTYRGRYIQDRPLKTEEEKFQNPRYSTREGRRRRKHFPKGRRNDAYTSKNIFWKHICFKFWFSK